MLLEDSKYLTKTGVYKKYKKWLSGIGTLKSKIEKLEEQKAAIRMKIDDDIKEAPTELVELHTKLFYIDKEIESVNELTAQYREHIPFTEAEVIEQYRETQKAIGKVMEGPEKKVKEAYESLENALREYKKIYNDYLEEASKEQPKWRRMVENVGMKTPSILTEFYPGDHHDIGEEYSSISYRAL